MNKYLSCDPAINPFLWYVSFYKYKSTRYIKENWKKLLFIIFWLVFGRLCYVYHFGVVYSILTITLLIFINLDYSGKKGNVSAYSVFNKGYKSLPGEFQVDNMFNTQQFK